MFGNDATRFIITGTADYIHRATQSHGTSSVDSFASEASLSTTLLPNMWAGDPALWLVWRYFGDLTGNMPLEVVILDADEFRRVMVKSPRALRCNQTHATLLQMYMKTMNWHTDVWCTAIADLQEGQRPDPFSRIPVVSPSLLGATLPLLTFFLSRPQSNDWLCFCSDLRDVSVCGPWLTHRELVRPP